MALAPVIDPPPLATANVTTTPLTPVPNASLTTTLGATGTTVPAFALCASPAFFCTCVAGGAVTVTVIDVVLRVPSEKTSAVEPAVPDSDRPLKVVTPLEIGAETGLGVKPAAVTDIVPVAEVTVLPP